MLRASSLFILKLHCYEIASGLGRSYSWLPAKSDITFICAILHNFRVPLFGCGRFYICIKLPACYLGVCLITFFSDVFIQCT